MYKLLAIRTKTLIYSLLAVFMMVQFSSCIPRKKLKYISDDGKDVKLNFRNIMGDKIIRPHDRLYIKILSLDEKTNQLFSEQTRMYGEMNMFLNSYEVNDSGYIDYPFVGKMYVEGYNLSQAKRKLEKEISQYLPNTSIQLKYAGNYITVLGEVKNPGNHLFLKEKISIFEALGYAGGVNNYGNKEEVVIVRTIDNQTRYHHVDITSKNITQTYFYYLLPDDVVIVQPLNLKFKHLRNFQLESLILSSITTVITVMYFFQRQ